MIALAHLLLVSNKQIKLQHVTPDDTVVSVANGQHISIEQKGTFCGKTDSGNDITFPMKQSDQFAHNLFSIRQAVTDGHRAVFDSSGSYVEYKRTGTRIPLHQTATGWDVVFTPSE